MRVSIPVWISYSRESLRESHIRARYYRCGATSIFRVERRDSRLNGADGYQAVRREPP